MFMSQAAIVSKKSTVFTVFTFLRRPNLIICSKEVKIALRQVFIYFFLGGGAGGGGAGGEERGVGRTGAVVRASDIGPRGPWFEPRSVRRSLWP